LPPELLLLLLLLLLPFETSSLRQFCQSLV
jgi:hypothetical protein